MSDFEHGVLRRNAHEGDAEERVRSGREDRELLAGALDREVHLDARGLADPVPLHRKHALGPARELVAVGEQLLGIGRDLEEPLLELLVLHHRTAAPAQTVLHLLVREHRIARRAPVHIREFLVREAPLVHLDEEPLVPAVILLETGGHLAVPVVGQAEPLELLVPHEGDVLEGPLLRDGCRA